MRRYGLVNTATKRRSVWSYSLYGDDLEQYYRPLFDVISLADTVGAQVVINTPGSNYGRVLQYYGDVLQSVLIACYEGEIAEKYPKVLRFLVSETIDADYYFFKDSDSLVGVKELEIMDHWMSLPEADYMIVRDHPLHVSPIMAGMFAVSARESRGLVESARSYFAEHGSRLNGYSYDQEWLKNAIYPLVRTMAHVYTSYLHFYGERVCLISRTIENYAYIGAQQYKMKPGVLEVCEFEAIYGDGCLCLPFVPKLDRFLPNVIYGRVRPTLMLAFLYTRIFKLGNKPRSNCLSTLHDSGTVPRV